MSKFSIHVNNLYKRFGSQIVFQNISFDHGTGIMGIAGSNGSGKTTLLRCIAGIMSSTRGKIKWLKNGQSIDNDEFKKHLGYAAPYINLYKELSCSENLNFLLQLRNYTDRSKRVSNVLKKTAMTAFCRQPYGNLSTGQQQRMRIAASLVHQPEVLFLDEPGANLDEEGRKVVESIVSKFKKTDKLVVIASNNGAELNLCDKIYSVEEEKTLSLKKI